MKRGDEFVELDKTVHDRKSFDCGERELDDFIKTMAAQQMSVGVNITKVLPAAAPLSGGKYPICAFYTVAGSTVKKETFPDTLKKKLPAYPVHVFLVAQLAVHSDCQGEGLGKITLIKALEYVHGVKDHWPGVAVIVDCLDDSNIDFYAKYGFEFLCKQNGRTRMYMRMKVLSELFDDS